MRHGFEWTPKYSGEFFGIVEVFTKDFSSFSDSEYFGEQSFMTSSGLSLQHIINCH